MNSLVRRLLLGGFVLMGFPVAGRSQVIPSCERAGFLAEGKFALPPGLLRAIGQVESGRWDVAAGRMVAWPWSVDVEGTPYTYPSAGDARQATTAFLANGHRSIDVGCFQINLLHHPGAFADLDQAFDPEANADYAARFLVSLKDRTGSWEAAVAAYHSADPAIGVPYFSRVQAVWQGQASALRTIQIVYEPVANVHIWTPGATRSVDGPVDPGVSSSRTVLPRVITPR